MDGDLTRWLEHRRAEDREQQYHTQLATLEAALREGIRAVREDIGAIDGNARRAVVYARCREADKETVFLRRYWEYFASKWAQRDRDGETRDTLLAAEEIIWSRWDRVQGVGDPGGGHVAAVPGTRIRSIGASAHGPSASAARRDPPRRGGRRPAAAADRASADMPRAPVVADARGP